MVSIVLIWLNKNAVDIYMLHVQEIMLESKPLIIA